MNDQTAVPLDRNMLPDAVRLADHVRAAIVRTSVEPMENRVAENLSSADGNPRILALEAEVGMLRQRIQQREATLAVLNRRLLALERIDHGGAGLLEHTIALEQELERLRRRRLVRWSTLTRRLYTRVRPVTKA